MAHRKKHSAPVPPGNKAHVSPGAAPGPLAQDGEPGQGEIGSAQEQDPKRRLGDYEGKGEHSIQEPGGKKDANH